MIDQRCGVLLLPPGHGQRAQQGESQHYAGAWHRDSLPQSCQGPATVYQPASDSDSITILPAGTGGLRSASRVEPTRTKRPIVRDPDFLPERCGRRV